MRDPLRQTRYWLSETSVERLPAAQAEVAFVGRSNAGKSSLLCALCDNKTLARVSKTPGRTRGLNVFEATRGRLLLDLPGYGYADAPERQRDYWPEMIGRYLSERQPLNRIYVLMDAELGPSPVDVAMFRWLQKKGLPGRVVGAKVDRLNQTRQKTQRARMAEQLEISPEGIFWVSAKKKYGMNTLRHDVADALGF